MICRNLKPFPRYFPIFGGVETKISWDIIIILALGFNFSLIYATYVYAHLVHEISSLQMKTIPFQDFQKI